MTMAPSATSSTMLMTAARRVTDGLALGVGAPLTRRSVVAGRAMRQHEESHVTRAELSVGVEYRGQFTARRLPRQSPLVWPFPGRAQILGWVPGAKCG
jgi:hypothetical protein